MLNTIPGRPGDPIPVAVALLDRHWPASPPLADAVGTIACRTVIALETDPRYLIGRLQQALTNLLAADLPPMDTRTALLSQALADAIAWRHHHGRPCRHCALSTSLCESCNADWDQADRFRNSIPKMYSL